MNRECGFAHKVIFIAHKVLTVCTLIVHGALQLSLTAPQSRTLTTFDCSFRR